MLNAIGVRIPLLIGNSIDALQGTLSFSGIGRYALIIFVLASVMWVIRMISRIAIFGIGRQVEFDLKQTIFQHLLKLEPSYFFVNTSGDLINRATSDVDNVRRLVGFCGVKCGEYNLCLWLDTACNAGNRCAAKFNGDRGFSADVDYCPIV